MTQSLQAFIDQAWEQRTEFSPKTAPADVREAVAKVIAELNQGTLRVAEKTDGNWVVNQWIKKAVLLSFRLEDNLPMPAGDNMQFYDKVPTKFANYTAEDFAKGGFRVVPPAVARHGSFIDISADVDIGRHQDHVLADEAAVTDNCFVGARSEIVEGVIVEENSVISMGVYIGQSTKIYDRATGEVTYGRIPSGSVVVSGSLPSADGKYSLYCAVIVKRVDAKTRAKTGINELLREA